MWRAKTITNMLHGIVPKKNSSLIVSHFIGYLYFLSKRLLYLLINIISSIKWEGKKTVEAVAFSLFYFLRFRKILFFLCLFCLIVMLHNFCHWWNLLLYSQSMSKNIEATKILIYHILELYDFLKWVHQWNECSLYVWVLYTW